MIRNEQSGESVDLLSRVSCHLQIYQEKIPNNGEDAYVYSMNTRNILLGVFDGCGGSGAKRYGKLQGKTGAYVASRLVSGSLKDWFGEYTGENTTDLALSMKRKIQQNLQLCNSVGGEESRLVSSMVKSFPTTAAYALIGIQSGKICVDYFWAGDSRVYLLDSDGLAQLSVDDLPISDAMQNLYDDGVMTNMISKSKDFTIHHGKLLLDKPAIIFAATDGCFGYVSTPMEFEYLLIDTLLNSNSISTWEYNLHRSIGKCAGDDYSLCGVALDYENFDRIRNAFIARGNILFRDYISGIENLDREQKTALWGSYKLNYNRMQKKI